MKLMVKNMVCDRCRSVLKNEFSNADIPVEEIRLGEIRFSEGGESQLGRIEEILTDHGFELIADREAILVELVKKSLMEKLNANNAMNVNLSEFLARRLNREYSIISKVFRRHQGMTVEKYFIRLKIERAKEFIQMKDRTFSEIAYELNYSSGNHLAKQFKAITGMSMSAYRNIRYGNRKPLDKIV